MAEANICVASIFSIFHFSDDRAKEQFNYLYYISTFSIKKKLKQKIILKIKHFLAGYESYSL